MTTKLTIYILHFFIKGWLVGLLILLPFLQAELNLSLIDIGLLSAVVTGASIFAAFYAGDLQSRFGAKNTILLTIFLFLITWLSFIFIHIPSVIWISYFLGGVSAGLFDPVATALVVRNSAQNQKGSAIGDYGAAGDIGRIIMTTVTTVLLGIISIQTSSIIYALVATAVGLAFFILQRRNPTLHLKKEVHVTQASLKILLKRKLYLLALSANVLDIFSSASLFIYLPFLLTIKGIQLAATGLFTTLFFVGFFAGRIVLGRVSDKHGAAKTLMYCQAVMAILIFALTFLQFYWTIVISLFLLGIVTRGTSPVVKSMLTESLDNHELEKGLSFTSSFVRIGNVISRSLFGFIGAFWGIESIFITCGFIALFTIIPVYAFYITSRRNI